MADLSLDPVSDESLVTYEQLAQIEKDFEDIDTEIMTRQELLSRPLYTKRRALTRRLPTFWPLVFEQAPPEIDAHIQPSDSQLFALALRDFSVSRFETPDSLPEAPSSSSPNTHTSASTFGEPRSLSFRFEFAPNEWFEDTVLEKRFWFRRAKGGWAGRVSEPVRIRWKQGKDLTDGLLEGAVRLWEAEQKAGGTMGKKLPEWQALKKRVDRSMEGSASFFAWFGYRGPAVSAEESAEATKAIAGKREGEKRRGESDGEREEEEEAEAEAQSAFQERCAFAAQTELFPDGEELAINLAEDLWPGALKYFSMAQENDSEFSQSDFEDEDGEDASVDGEEGIPDLRSLVKGSQRGGGEGGSGVEGVEMPPSKRLRKA